jgi:hypothetical protein
MKKILTKGAGLFNKIISNLPVELHLPSYNYCGPGTRLAERLARGDPPINDLDAACKEHDIKYSQFSDLENRHIADKILEEKAKDLSKTGKSFSERKYAWLVNKAIKGKLSFGMGLSKKKMQRKKKSHISFNKAVKQIRKKK